MALPAERMTDQDAPRLDVGAVLDAHDRRSFMRFLTCGSVDDGKSTLIGRLLYDTKLIFEDQLAALERDSKKHGTNGEEIDFALLVDGLEAEREQGITIDVAYRFFSTPKRKFIVADTPGHEQYTRNMATGASTADLAIVLVDARHGIMRQTRRHAFIASLLGIRHLVLAVNKIDLVGWSQQRFRQIEEEFRAIAAGLGFRSYMAIPLSARFGDNVTTRSANMGWYNGPTLLAHLETVEVGNEALDLPFRFPVQYVNRPNLDFRGFAGTIASGRVAVGDPLVVAKSGQPAAVARIIGPDGERRAAREGEAVTIVLDREVELARGNMLAAPTARPKVADRLSARLVWFDDQPMSVGRAYVLRTETDQCGATVTALHHRVDVNDYSEQPAERLAMNEIGLAELSTQFPVAFDAFADNRATGTFILIDRLTNRTVAAGMLVDAARGADNIHWQALEVDKAARAELKGQRPAVYWFTGLSGSGKSTIANLLEKRLHAAGRHTYLLDGDNVRHGLNRDLGFSETDRAENIRRVGEVSKLMADAGLIVLVSFISPYRAERDAVRASLAEGEFVEVFVDTPVEECARRDPKGLYAKVRAGELKDFTGIDAPYEAPLKPDIHLRTVGRTPEEIVEALMERIAGSPVADSFGDGGGI
ncbi:MAG: sulfate adenylyltransferase subunit CysN [Rhizobiaceae bacterium]|nr:sulfate adenylyltransferase subunit CysN [Rhizobiaceae bacterium]